MSDIAQHLSQTIWFDIPAAHLADAMSFYEGLLGWRYAQMENSPVPDYVMVEVRGNYIGGIRQIQKPLPPQKDVSAPILYFTVEQLDPKVARAQELGATIVGKPVELGKGRGRYQWIRDREGNLIGLWAPE